MSQPLQFLRLGISWGLHDSGDLIVVAVLVVLIFVLYFGGVMWFANRHPGVALLEGAELIQWRRLDMITKSGAPISSVPIPYEPNGKDPET